MVRPDPAPAADPPPADRAEAARGLVERQMAMLTRLAEIGMEIAESAGRRARLAEGGEANADGSDPGLSYARAARAVRLTLALQTRLAQDLAGLDRAEPRARVAEAARRRDRIRRRVDAVIEAEREGGRDVEHLSSDAWERLTDEDDADLLGRPMDEVVARICADLGLSPAWAEAFTAPGPAPPEAGPDPGRGDAGWTAPRGPPPHPVILRPREDAVRGTQATPACPEPSPPASPGRAGR